jgi:Leucine-rich repeat (LRR) protein
MEQGPNPSECVALLEFYRATQGDKWTVQTHWPTQGMVAPGVIPRDCCAWYGVVCNARGNVTILDLRSNNLRGEFPSAISQLGSLTELRLSNNHLNGSLAPLKQLKALESLHLRNNRYSGELSGILGDLPSLSQLYVDNPKVVMEPVVYLTKKNDSVSK